MTDKINASIVMILRGSMKRLRLQIEAGEEYEARHMTELVNECDMLAGAIDAVKYEARLGSEELYLETIGDL